MAGLKGGSGPPGNMNAFKHGLAAIQKRREESVTTEHEESVRQQILDGLIAHKGVDEQVSTATRMYRCFSVMGGCLCWINVRHRFRFTWYLLLRVRTDQLKNKG